jgi:hypothetical protein
MKHLRIATQLAKKSRQPLPPPLPYSTPTVPITSQMNPLNTYTPHTFKSLFNITHPRTPTSTKWCSPFRYPDCEQIALRCLHCAYLSCYYRQTDLTLGTCNGSKILIQSSYIPTCFGGRHHHHYQGSPTPLTKTPLL